VANFTDRLINGQLVASGFCPFVIDRVPIPRERWFELWPNFVENRAAGSELSFTNVRIFEPTDRPGEVPALLDRCVECMQTRSQQGESCRKVLQTEASVRFGTELTTRTFGAAYTKVFAKPRDRPRRSATYSIELGPPSGGMPAHDESSPVGAPQGDPVAPHDSVPGTVAPLGITHVITVCGRILLVQPDRTIEVTEEEAMPLRAAGIAALNLDSRNPRRHSRRQVRQIAYGIRTFGFNVPVLVNAELSVIAGHGRLLACRELGWTELPTIRLEDLSDTQGRVFMIADNRLTEVSTWDDRLLAEQLKELSILDLDFDLEATGFTMGEIELRVEGLANSLDRRDDPADALPPLSGPAISRSGELWQLGEHRICCGSPLESDNRNSSSTRRPLATLGPHNCLCRC
jgi:hypothetical protein